jgi:hypothetical protein
MQQPFCYVGFEVLTAVVIKYSVFWGIKPCSPLKVNRLLGATCHLYIQGRRKSLARNQHEVGRKQGSVCVSETPIYFQLNIRLYIEVDRTLRHLVVLHSVYHLNRICILWHICSKQEL